MRNKYKEKILKLEKKINSLEKTNYFLNEKKNFLNNKIENIVSNYFYEELFNYFFSNNQLLVWFKKDGYLTNVKRFNIDCSIGEARWHYGFEVKETSELYNFIKILPEMLAPYKKKCVAQKEYDELKGKEKNEKE